MNKGTRSYCDMLYSQTEHMPLSAVFLNINFSNASYRYRRLFTVSVIITGRVVKIAFRTITLFNGDVTVF